MALTSTEQNTPVYPPLRLEWICVIVSRRHRRVRVFELPNSNQLGLSTGPESEDSQAGAEKLFCSGRR